VTALVLRAEDGGLLSDSATRWFEAATPAVWAGCAAWALTRVVRSRPGA